MSDEPETEEPGAEEGTCFVDVNAASYSGASVGEMSAR